jgi:hypothetical protein
LTQEHIQSAGFPEIALSELATFIIYASELNIASYCNIYILPSPGPHFLIETT